VHGGPAERRQEHAPGGGQEEGASEEGHGRMVATLTFGVIHPERVQHLPAGVPEEGVICR